MKNKFNIEENELSLEKNEVTMMIIDQGRDSNVDLVKKKIKERNEFTGVLEKRFDYRLDTCKKSWK